MHLNMHTHPCTYVRIVWSLPRHSWQFVFFFPHKEQQQKDSQELLVTPSGWETSRVGEIKEAIPKEGEVIKKKEAVRLNNADSIAKPAGELWVRTHSTMHLSLKKALLKLYVHSMMWDWSQGWNCFSGSFKKGLSSKCLSKVLFVEKKLGDCFH